MRQGGWTLRSSLWFVFLIALGLKTATSTWNNLKRGSIQYHRQLADRCERISVRHRNRATHLEDELSSRPISDPAITAGQRQEAKSWADSAQSKSLLAASLSGKAELCEQSLGRWIFLQYETLRNPPDLPVQHVSGRETRPWFKSGTLAAVLLHFTEATVVNIDFFGLACLVLAIVVGRKFARDRSVGDPPVSPAAA